VQIRKDYSDPTGSRTPVRKAGPVVCLPDKGMVGNAHPDETSIGVEAEVEKRGPGEDQGDGARQQALQQLSRHCHLTITGQ
jgi:hypothetical protein